MKAFSEKFQEEREIFWEKGILLKLSIHGAADVKGVRDRDFWLGLGVPRNLANAAVRVIRKKNILPVRRIENEIRQFVDDRQLKVNIPGFHYVPKALVPVIIKELKGFDHRYKKTANKELIIGYHTWVRALKKDYVEESVKIGATLSTIVSLIRHLNQLIPTMGDLTGAFFLEYYFAELSPPHGLKDVLDDQSYQKELHKFFHMMGRAAVLAKVSLMDEMLRVALDAENRLGYRKDKKGRTRKKVFQKTLVDHFQKFWVLAPRRDIFEDEKIIVTSRGMQELMAGDVDTVVRKLRKNDKFRKDVRCELGKTRTEIALYILAECKGRDIEKFVPDDIIQKAKEAKKMKIV